MERHSLERDAPQSVNLHLKEIHEPQLSANAGTRRRIVGPPREGAESSRHKFQTLGREHSSTEIFGWASAALGHALGLSQLIDKPTIQMHLSVLLPRWGDGSPSLEIFPLDQSGVNV